MSFRSVFGLSVGALSDTAGFALLREMLWTSLALFLAFCFLFVGESELSQNVVCEFDGYSFQLIIVRFQLTFNLAALAVVLVGNHLVFDWKSAFGLLQLLNICLKEPKSSRPSVLACRASIPDFSLDRINFDTLTVGAQVFISEIFGVDQLELVWVSTCGGQALGKLNLQRRGN